MVPSFLAKIFTGQEAFFCEVDKIIPSTCQISSGDLILPVLQDFFLPCKRNCTDGVSTVNDTAGIWVQY